MTQRSPTPHTSDPRGWSLFLDLIRMLPTAIIVLLLALACLALAGCGSAQDPRQLAAAREARIAGQQHAELLELVTCAHQHGLPLPPPEGNKVSTQGVNLKSQARKAALNLCYQKAVHKAAEEQEAERAKQGEPAQPTNTGPARPGSPEFAAERAQLVAVVSCARHHGVDLPKPDAHNNINTSGLHLKGRQERITNACLKQVVNEIATERQRQQAALARQQQSGPQHLGEETPTR